MKEYKILNRQRFADGIYSIVSLRFEDRMLIMKWRNEQIYHLRQNELLTLKDQNDYFATVVAKLFEQNEPNQILFSFLENDVCIGYGGLVHINWTDKNAEISFVMNTSLEKDFFQFHWKNYLRLIEKVAFQELKFHKIFTYAFDLRPNLYRALESVGFSKEAVLKEHCFFDGEYHDVIIHSKKKNDSIELCLATFDDAQLLFDWANDKLVRHNSLSTKPILLDTHLKWLSHKLNSESKIYLLRFNKTSVGQIRFDFIDDFWFIDYSIDEKYRGKGFGKILIELGMLNFRQGDTFKAVVKKENISSLRIFQKLGFEGLEADSDIITFVKKIN
ncbi:GNAT family N-acetyltransferase [Flavobacterium sp. TAB 87]|uniref:GNAT family N-acetyltransferase n=1 Tax=Flavobacterium sp. TAB 87 TaxID=1729581 RepID=UPI00076C173D|nr:GNAT family N-acetyltransferase [Flavobacterium sp. TAB 87]KVV13960.1 pseudaminic acid biosynthesis N-acetyl transferase [Flavobacterium sp. TAB 87]